MAFAARWGEKSSCNDPMYLHSVVADWPQQSLQWEELTYLMQRYMYLRCAGKDKRYELVGL